MQIVFFKNPTPRQFDYKPRYYDEEKERREKLRKRSENPTENATSSLRMEIKQRWRKSDRANRTKAKGINLLVYAAIAAFIIYFIFFV